MTQDQAAVPLSRATYRLWPLNVRVPSLEPSLEILLV